jgi:cob(I)alamin adenosyltransferase
MQKPYDTLMENSDLKILHPKERSGLVVVLTGHGKGKTTAALGIALRAAGYGMKVCIIGFVKGDTYSGEVDGIKRLAPNVELHLTGRGFCGIRGDPLPFEEHRAKAQDAMELAKEKIFSGKYDIVILDEIHNALQLNLVDLTQVLRLIDEKPPLVHIILTGRDAPPEIISRAHTVTEMKEIKHAFRQGIEPQQGIDY